MLFAMKMKSTYASTFGRAALAPTLKKIESASATVTKMSPLTEIAYAIASFEKGEAELSIFVRTSVRHTVVGRRRRLLRNAHSRHPRRRVPHVATSPSRVRKVPATSSAYRDSCSKELP